MSTTRAEAGEIVIPDENPEALVQQIRAQLTQLEARQVGDAHCLDPLTVLLLEVLFRTAKETNAAASAAGAWGRRLSALPAGVIRELPPDHPRVEAQRLLDLARRLLRLWAVREMQEPARALAMISANPEVETALKRVRTKERARVSDLDSGALRQLQELHLVAVVGYGRHADVVLTADGEKCLGELEKTATQYQTITYGASASSDSGRKQKAAYLGSN